MTAIGKVYPLRTMFLRVGVGTGEDNVGNKYDIATNISDSSPIVYSQQTKKYFTLSWADIIRLAVKAGIDKPGKLKQKGHNESRTHTTEP